MKRWTLRVVFLAGIVALGWWVWDLFAPNPELAIRKRLAELARAASVPSEEAPFAGVLNSQKLASFFTADARISVDVPGHSQVTLADREELVKAVIQVRSLLSGLRVEFLDIRVTVAADQHLATTHMTGRARIPGDANFYVQELRVTLKRIGGEWMIIRVEGIRTLSRGPPTGLRLAGGPAGFAKDPFEGIL